MAIDRIPADHQNRPFEDALKGFTARREAPPEPQGDLAKKLQGLISSGVLDQRIENKLKKMTLEKLDSTTANAAMSYLRGESLTAAWGVGPTTARAIESKHGLKTMEDLARFLTSGKQLDKRITNGLGEDARARLETARTALAPLAESPKQEPLSLNLSKIQKLVNARYVADVKSKGRAEAHTLDAQVIKGVGKDTRAYFEGAGVRTIGDFVRADLSKLFAAAPPPGVTSRQAFLRNVQSAFKAAIVTPKAS